MNSARNFINPLNGSRRAILVIATIEVVNPEKIPNKKKERNIGIPKRSNLRFVNSGKGIFKPDSLKDQSKTKISAPKSAVPAMSTLFLLKESKVIDFNPSKVV